MVNIIKYTRIVNITYEQICLTAWDTRESGGMSGNQVQLRFSRGALLYEKVRDCNWKI